MHVWKLAVGISSFHSYCQVVYSLVRMTVCFSAAQTWCLCRSARILLHVNMSIDDVIAEKKSNNFVLVKNNWMFLKIFCLNINWQ